MWDFANAFWIAHHLSHRLHKMKENGMKRNEKNSFNVKSVDGVDTKVVLWHRKKTLESLFTHYAVLKMILKFNGAIP
jgi:hypothetical protein